MSHALVAVQSSPGPAANDRLRSRLNEFTCSLTRRVRLAIKEQQRMSEENRSHHVQEQTQQLLQGPLKHVRAAALAAALLPLASVVATPASAQSVCPSAGVCGIV